VSRSRASVPRVTPPTGFASLSRDQLAVLVPELLLAGHLIDRAGMPHAIGAFGREGMAEVAIAEWMGASPVYTKRMQVALGFDGDDGVETIFKGMQLDIGAPPQFLDFRYRLLDHDRGEFWLDHCGALMDVEPMGDEYVVSMCHDIEDPTFDATAIATNTRAQVRPVHRPPRTPSDRHPHCAWTVTIADDHPALPTPDEAVRMGGSLAASVELSPIVPTAEGRSDYAGPLLADLRFDEWSHPALVRIAEEVCLQGHVLSLAFLWAVADRSDVDTARAMTRRQLTGVAAVASERIRAALDLPGGLDGAAALLPLHPALAPSAYVQAEVDLTDGVHLRIPADAPAVRDGGWASLVEAGHLEPLDALLRGLDPHLRAEAVEPARGDALTVRVVVDDEPAREASEVGLVRFSTGVDFSFADRGTPVELRPVGR
jgi:hypothetical protein